LVAFAAVPAAALAGHTRRAAWLRAGQRDKLEPSMTIRLPPPREPGSPVTPDGKRAPGSVLGRARGARLVDRVPVTVGGLAVWLAVAVTGGALAYEVLAKRPEPPPRCKHVRDGHAKSESATRASLACR
jgi:hypothetical protein